MNTQQLPSRLDNMETNPLRQVSVTSLMFEAHLKENKHISQEIGIYSIAKFVQW